MSALAEDLPAPSPERQASGSSFYAAMRLLPAAERDAMFAVYAFCRQIDDIADEPGRTTAERIAALDEWRAELAALYAGETPARAAFLAEPIRRFGLSQADFLDLVAGMQMDAEGPIRIPTFQVLDLYCDRVASAVGRLSVRIFGMPHEPGLTLAHHLGRALQLTNILRDLDEDAEMGRLYLPAEALAEAGIESRDPIEVVDAPQIDEACRWVARRARSHYEAADGVLKARPAGRLRSPRLMREVYDEMLRGMETAGWRPPRRRFKIGKARLLWIVLRYGLVD